LDALNKIAPEVVPYIVAMNREKFFAMPDILNIQ
jgi:hypothetical protein